MPATPGATGFTPFTPAMQRPLMGNMSVNFSEESSESALKPLSFQPLRVVDPNDSQINYMPANHSGIIIIKL